MEKRKKPFRATFRQSVIGRYVEKCEGKNVTIKHTPSSKNNSLTMIYSLFSKFRLKNLVIGLQKRYDPSKSYYFIMDVVWSDGSQLMIYRQGQNSSVGVQSAVKIWAIFFNPGLLLNLT